MTEYRYKNAPVSMSFLPARPRPTSPPAPCFCDLFTPVQDHLFYARDLHNARSLQLRLLDWWHDDSAMRNLCHRPAANEGGFILAAAAFKAVLHWEWEFDHDSVPDTLGGPVPTPGPDGDAAEDDSVHVEPCPPEQDVWLAAVWASILNMSGMCFTGSSALYICPNL